jgi:hypothetical protein
MKYSKIECPNCKRLIANTNIKRHIECCLKLEKSTCPVCGKHVSRGAITCGYSCSNKFFRSGENNGSWKPDEDVSYTVVCFRHHERKCVVCPEDKIVAVHHYDHDRSNNDWRNLIPLCPTHHSYMHSRWKYLIEEKVNEYWRSLACVK